MTLLLKDPEATLDYCASRFADLAAVWRWRPRSSPRRSALRTCKGLRRFNQPERDDGWTRGNFATRHCQFQYIVGVAAIGAWSGKDGKIAGFTEGGWRFVTPVNDADSRSQPPPYGLWRSGGDRIVGAEEVRIDGVRVVRPAPAGNTGPQPGEQ